MHRMHHTYSDTEHDPHSPHFFKDVYQMMHSTILIFRGFLTGKNLPMPSSLKNISCMG
jgi:stearoyl-CoA desaturase (delta-9 desaturase)